MLKDINFYKEYNFLFFLSLKYIEILYMQVQL